MNRFVLVMLVAVLFLTGCMPSEKPVPTVTPDPNTWKTYVNDTFDYSIQHPSRWNIYDSSAGNVTFKLDSEEFVIVKVYGILPGWSASEIIEKRMQYIRQNQDEADYSSWHKQKSIWEGSWEINYHFTSHKDSRLQAREIAIPGDSYVYEVSGSAKAQSEGVSSHYAIVNAVVDSFRIISR